MPRNKYPEETVQKILDVATKLFIEKGYEHTTIGDIVAGLGGMTRGAVYHHFKNKEEILDAVTTRMYWRSNPLELARRESGDGLEQIRLALRHSLAGPPGDERLALNRQIVDLLREPKYLAQHVDDSYRLAWHDILPMIELAGAQGANIPHPKQAAEAMMLLLNLWLIYSPEDMDAAELAAKLDFAADTLAAMGLPVLDEELKALCLQAYGCRLDD